MFFLKLKYFFHYYKSKTLKKRCKKDYASQKKIFEQKLDHKNFSQKWFLNNFEIFTFFLPKDKNLKFDYLEVGCYEGLSSFYVLSEYKSVNAFFLDIWDMPNPNSCAQRVANAIPFIPIAGMNSAPYMNNGFKNKLRKLEQIMKLDRKSVV